MLKFTKRPKTPGITLKKHGFFWRELAICKWFSCSSGWNKIRYSSIYKEIELEMDSLTSRIPLQKAPSYKYQFFTKFCISSRLVSQIEVMAGQNIKKKYLLICQIPIKILKQYAIPNSSFQNSKIFSSKGYRRTSQK